MKRNLVIGLNINRVDLVDEGSNSQAFIELYKRKEHTKPMTIQEIFDELKKEHVEVIKSEIAKAKAEVPEDVQTKVDEFETELAKAKAEMPEGVKEKLDAAEVLIAKSKEADNKATEEDIYKALPEEAKKIFDSFKAKIEAAENIAATAIEKRKEEEAIEKAKPLKALPIEDAKLVDIVKSASADVYDLLKASSELIEKGALNELGSKGEEEGQVTSKEEAWAKIEKRALKVATEENINKSKAIEKVINDNPDLYDDYVRGGKQ